MGRNAINTEQLDLIEDLVGPDAKKIATAARELRRIVDERKALGEEEGQLKATICELIKSSGIQPSGDGVYRVRVNGLIVVIKPASEKITISDAKESEGGDD